jgi:hypothetical protein
LDRSGENQKSIIMLKNFFILCSGADKNLINSCSNAEQNKYAGIGATVFFTAIMAFIAASYALFSVFDNVYMAIGFGFVWGLLIFNLDRYIVSTIKKRDQFKMELLQAFPRIMLAIIIAIVISKPLEIKIFEKEINTVLLKEKNDLAIQNKSQVTDFFKKDLEQNQAKIDSLKSDILKKESEVNSLYNTYITEAEGTSGTKKLGKGPVYKEKREKHDMALKELDTLKAVNMLKIKNLETEAKTIQSNLDKKIQDTQPIIDNFGGLMARINALNKLPLIPSLFIMLLFFAIETAPIIAKLLAPKGEYDFKIEDYELAAVNVVAQNKYQSELQRKTDAEIYDTIYADIKNDQELYHYKKQKATELLKLQADGFVAKQKKQL